MNEENVLHVEICQHANSTLANSLIQVAVDAELKLLGKISLDIIQHGKDFVSPVVQEHVESIICSSDYSERGNFKVEGSTIKYYIYRLTEEGAATETIQSDSDELSVASHWLLPAQEFHYMWENLYYDCDIKNNLLRFVETTMLFSDLAVNSNIISWNKVILLHGPPGTGKTSMCKALAQKACIRMGDRFTHGEFIEINSHSLFSKWFSESGKLVMKLFDEIRSMVQNEKALICILIDEVESLAHARKLCSNGAEPSDSIRVVNALLTQLDQIKRYPNVLILTTSNMTEAIDLAFVDRADIKQYLGYPSEVAIYNIYYSCLKELMRAGILEHEHVYDLSQLKLVGYTEDINTKNSLKLLELSRESEGLTGRTLRKIPFLAHALHLSSHRTTLCKFLKAMHTAILKQDQQDGELLKS
ncbi:pachytene checkpoint protein 2 homolog [Pseudomyrmex gracilis]|uniref:pachytene checkpoint protein 2 homolog n=1 Tax=Pseudomyrmex gracilis TaxID=219809 RepID=UPI000995892F|nr:pachytene checkpoint protein 2 homolog [Pseudomyrmex gracilis]XP_020282190.1 pachytene checkpoint protein 2 homolog [Pseudomyrmex gracilis]XP_020282191.1 pachytene checkpoint protein 2 homolog [Pseudomyrmex gracilis]XP_020282193.1 pachytene checkpoint protein 2 homolog [Pseudomyrmex gracilis]